MSKRNHNRFAIFPNLNQCKINHSKKQKQSKYWVSKDDILDANRQSCSYLTIYANTGKLGKLYQSSTVESNYGQNNRNQISKSEFFHHQYENRANNKNRTKLRYKQKNSKINVDCEQDHSLFKTHNLNQKHLDKKRFDIIQTKGQQKFSNFQNKSTTSKKMNYAHKAQPARQLKQNQDNLSTAINNLSQYSIECLNQQQKQNLALNANFKIEDKKCQQKTNFECKYRLKNVNSQQNPQNKLFYSERTLKLQEASNKYCEKLIKIQYMEQKYEIDSNQIQSYYDLKQKLDEKQANMQDRYIQVINMQKKQNLQILILVLDQMLSYLQFCESKACQHDSKQLKLKEQKLKIMQELDCNIDKYCNLLLDIIQI